MLPAHIATIKPQLDAKVQLCALHYCRKERITSECHSNTLEISVVLDAYTLGLF